MNKFRILYVIMMMMGGALVISPNLSQAEEGESFIASNNQSLAAQSASMVLPLDYQQSFVLYATVDRRDNVSRNIYISPQGADAIRNGQSLPDGTMIIIEAYTSVDSGNGNRLQQVTLQDEVHVLEIRSNWSADDLIANLSVDNGSLNFARFNRVTGQEIQNNIAECFDCHQDAGGRRDFIFSMPLLQNFAQTGVVQYQFCNQPEREICRGGGNGGGGNGGGGGGRGGGGGDGDGRGGGRGDGDGRGGGRGGGGGGRGGR